MTNRSRYTVPTRNVTTTDTHPAPGMTVRTCHEDGEFTAHLLYVGGWEIGQYKTDRGLRKAIAGAERDGVAVVGGVVVPGAPEGATLTPGRAADLADGSVFSLDDGAHWHVAAVNMAAMGTVAIYMNNRRDDAAPTMRVEVQSDTAVLVARPAAPAAAVVTFEPMCSMACPGSYLERTGGQHMPGCSG